MVAIRVAQTKHPLPYGTSLLNDGRFSQDLCEKEWMYGIDCSNSDESESIQKSTLRSFAATREKKMQ